MRNAFIGLIVLLLFAGGIVCWQLLANHEPVAPQTAVPPKVAQPASATPATPPPAAPVASVAPPAPLAAAPAETPAPEPERPLLTAETLQGTSWEDGRISMAFLPDGRWQMNGRVCAKWEVLGDKVRIFDDKGEEHFVDIVGDSLAFNGKKIAKAAP